MSKNELNEKEMIEKEKQLKMRELGYNKQVKCLEDLIESINKRQKRYDEKNKKLQEEEILTDNRINELKKKQQYIDEEEELMLERMKRREKMLMENKDVDLLERKLILLKLDEEIDEKKKNISNAKYMKKLRIVSYDCLKRFNEQNENKILNYYLAGNLKPEDSDLIPRRSISRYFERNDYKNIFNFKNSHEICFKAYLVEVYYEIVLNKFV